MKTAFTLLISYLLNKIATAELTESPPSTRLETLKLRTSEMNHNFWERVSQTKNSIHGLMRAQEEMISSFSTKYAEPLERIFGKAVKVTKDKMEDFAEPVESEYSIRNDWNNFLELKGKSFLALKFDLEFDLGFWRFIFYFLL